MEILFYLLFLWREAKRDTAPTAKRSRASDAPVLGLCRCGWDASVLCSLAWQRGRSRGAGGSCGGPAALQQTLSILPAAFRVRVTWLQVANLPLGATHAHGSSRGTWRWNCSVRGAHSVASRCDSQVFCPFESLQEVTKSLKGMKSA